MSVWGIPNNAYISIDPNQQNIQEAASPLNGPMDSKAERAHYHQGSSIL